MKFCARAQTQNKTYHDQFVGVHYEWNMHKFFVVVDTILLYYFPTFAI